MGNTVLCTPSTATTTKVVDSCGTLREYANRRVRAGDLMADNPSEFVCEWAGLVVGQRIEGLPPDQTLEPGAHRFYILLPLDLLYSVLTQEELSTLTQKAAKAIKQYNSINVRYQRCLRRIFPVCMNVNGMFSTVGRKEGKGRHRPRRRDEVPGTDNDEELVEEIGGSYVKQRSWKPALETIVENSS